MNKPEERLYARRILTHVNVNMRDLGGYPAAGASFTRFGRFIRSGEPVGLSGGDIDFLKKYGVKTAIDMRAGFETDVKHALRGVNGVNYLNIPFSNDMGLLYAEPFKPEEHYVPLLTGKNGLADIFDAMADAAPGGIIFNCLAGKDRTGMVSAILLLLAGVHVDDVLTDYHATYIYMSNYYERYITDKYAPKLNTSPEVLFPFLDFLKTRGGADDYLTDIGVSDRRKAALKRRLTGDF